MMQQNKEAQVLRTQKVAVGLGVLIMVAKFAAYFITGSNTILTDALESIVNIVAGVFAVYSLHLSSKPKDADHPYGHGKIEFISTGFEGGLIILASVLIIGKSFLGFFEHQEVHHLDWGLALVTAAGSANYLVGVYMVKMGSRFHSRILDADGQHLRADGYISLGIMLGIVMIWVTGWQQLDNVFGIIAGACIAYPGLRLVRRSLGGIMDETDTGIITSIVSHLNGHRRPAWIDIHNLRVIQYGSTLHIDCHVTMPWYYTLEQTHAEIDEITKLISDYSDSPVELFMHADPCIPVSCTVCQIAECPVRKNAFKKRVEWDFANTTINRKHSAA